MRLSIHEFQERRLIDHLCSLKVAGDVIEKRKVESYGGQPEMKIVVVKFRNRIIETRLDDAEFDQAGIGDQVLFTPPVPERELCNCHLFIWLTVGVVAGALAMWAITYFFQGRGASVLSLVAAALISLVVWAKICSHEQNKYLRDLGMEAAFYHIEDGRKQNLEQE